MVYQFMLKARWEGGEEEGGKGDGLGQTNLTLHLEKIYRNHLQRLPSLGFN